MDKAVELIQKYINKEEKRLFSISDEIKELQTQIETLKSEKIVVNNNISILYKASKELERKK